MLKNAWGDLKKRLFKIRSFLIAKFIKNFMNLIFKTYRLQVSGLPLFYECASKRKCMVMLWHNRLALTPFILSKFTPDFKYAAVVSASRDGDVLSNIIHSYKNGNTIRVPHLGRYQALKKMIQHVNEGKEIVILTPDGPRGPVYEIKSGIAVCALETQACIFGLDWQAESYWEFKTWDRFRLPKPFTTIHISFNPPICFNQFPQPSLDEAKAILSKSLKND